MIVDTLSDIRFYVGLEAWEILPHLDDDMTNLEVAYTLEELKLLIVTELIEQGRTYDKEDL